MEFSLSMPGGFEKSRIAAQENALEKLARTADALAAKENDELKYYAEEIESLFIFLLLKEMRKTVPETKLFHGGRAEEIFRDMYDEEISRHLAHAPGGGMGIADMLYRQLSRPGVAAAAAQNSDGKQGLNLKK